MADEPSIQSTQKKKACTECRQQKAKCNAYLNPSQACSRCKRLGLECFISAPFKRENKRQRLSELEKETDTLRKRLMTEDYQSATIDSIRTEHSNPSIPPSTITSSEAATYATPSVVLPNQNYATASSTISPAANRVLECQASTTTTTPRTLDGVTVSANDINNIFGLFFRDYSPFIPVLDSRLSPDTCYQQSPLLFWSIIGTACRSYAQNPTLLNALTKGITNSALLSVTATRSPLQRVQAFLLLVNWPLPDAVETNQQEVNFVLAGLLLHLAQRCGLHVPAGSDEFFRAKMPNLPDMGMVKRSELWTYIVLTYQRGCLCKGFLARTSSDIAPEMSQFQARQQALPPALKLCLKWQDLCVQCGSAVSENGMRDLTADQDRALSIIIKTFETQIKDLEHTATDDADRLECQMALLYIRSFYFLKQEPTSHAKSFNLIQQTCQHLVTSISALIQNTPNPLSIPLYIVGSLLFSSYALLRILKSSVPFLSPSRSEATSSFFLAISLIKQLSIDQNDMCAKSTTYLTKLWNSDQAFKKADGSDMLGLRARSRLNGSHVVDSILWWREEFDPHFKAQMLTLKNSALAPLESSKPNHRPSEPTQTQLDLQQPTMDFANTWLFDFDHFMGADLSFSQDFFAFPGFDGMDSSNQGD